MIIITYVLETLLAAAKGTLCAESNEAEPPPLSTATHCPEAATAASLTVSPGASQSFTAVINELTSHIDGQSTEASSSFLSVSLCDLSVNTSWTLINMCNPVARNVSGWKNCIYQESCSTVTVTKKNLRNHSIHRVNHLSTCKSMKMY